MQFGRKFNNIELISALALDSSIINTNKVPNTNTNTDTDTMVKTKREKYSQNIKILKIGTHKNKKPNHLRRRQYCLTAQVKIDHPPF
jgi:hypothetical protein